MRALTLTQPWAGLVASGIKKVENRPRRIIKAEDFGKPFAIHASRMIDESVYARVYQIAPEMDRTGQGFVLQPPTDWWHLSRITSVVIAVATIDKVFEGGWDAESIAKHADVLSFSSGELLGPSQARWFFGPIGYVLRDIRALASPVPCRGKLGFWHLSAEVEREVRRQL